jgi:hypothetical protein
MLLAPQEAQLFFKLHRGLSCYVNQRLKIVPDIGTPEQFGDVAPEARLKVRQALVQHAELIDSFVAENPYGFSAEELKIVRSWRHFVARKFYVFRYLARYTIFLSSEKEPVAYGVVALTQPFEELIGNRLPYITQAVLLPFEGKIVYDGLLASYDIALSFGPGIRRMLNETYKEAKHRQGIVTSLPARVGVDSSVVDRPTSKPAPRKRAPSTGSAEIGERLKVILAMTDQFCRERLNEEYAALCRSLAEKLARKRPSPLLKGDPTAWAGGIVRTIGSVNFLHDPSQSPHMRMTDIDAAFGVGQSTAQARMKTIRTTLKIYQCDPEWTLPSRMDNNPFAWMIEVDGLVVDVRACPREIQEIAFQKGLIPYLPADRHQAGSSE